MRTLIICIDRDDDLGVKAGVSSPIIGRQNNIDAAIRLAVVDPEDSDFNTIFGGVNVYDKLRKDGRDVEIVSIAGDKDVGIVSDQKIANQLDGILEDYKADRAIVISDGAEDEALLPIIQSRIKVDAVNRIIVKQHENLESTYYIIKKAFNDPKISHTFFMPLGLAFLIYAISLYAEHPELAVIAITGAVGIYMLFRGTGLDDALAEFKASMISGKITFVMYVIAIILTVVGTIQGAADFWKFYTQGIFAGYLILIMVFLNSSIWWYVAAGMFMSLGTILDLHLEKKSVVRKLSHPFFVFSSGLIFWSGSTYILAHSSLIEYTLKYSGNTFLFAMIIVGVIISLIGTWISRMSVKN